MYGVKNALKNSKRGKKGSNFLLEIGAGFIAEMVKMVKTVNGKLLTPTRTRVGRHLTPLGYRRNACTSFATTRSFAHELLELLAQNLQV